MSEANTPTPQERAQGNGSHNNLPPVAIMERMLDLQEKRLALDSRQLDINERELDSNKSLGLRSMELNAAANTERTKAMMAIVGWRYKFWLVIALFTAIAVITALILGKEAFVIEALKYVAIFVGGYGTSSVVHTKKKKLSQPDDET